MLLRMSSWPVPAQTNFRAGDARVRILIVGGNQLYTDLLAQDLGRQPGIEVLSSTIDPSAAVELGRRLKPDLVLLDSEATLGAVVARAIIAAAPAVVVVAVGISETPEELRRWAEAGAACYVARTMRTHDLLRVIADLTGPDTLALKAGLLGYVLDSQVSSSSETLIHRLTRRERQVVELVAAGFTNKEIATRLSLSLPTVKSHVHRILAKFDMRTRAEVAACLGQRGSSAGERRPVPVTLDGVELI